MYYDSGYWHNSRLDFKDTKHPLFVGSAGTYRLITRPKLPTHRPRGRLDFQLLYVASGKAHFYFHGNEEIVPAGNMVLYRPREEQRYYYYGVDHTEVFWVHFTGNDVTNILRRYGFKDKEHVIHTGCSLEYAVLFRDMIRELKKCRTDYEEKLVLSLRTLFILIHRLDDRKESGTKGRKRHPLQDETDTAVRYFHEHYMEPVSIEHYAREHGMSVSYFIRKFREYTQTTPAQYLLSLRISMAQSLLENTGQSISEIASSVGYENPLYFSRLFHKMTGVSPSTFRKQILEFQEESPEGFDELP